MVYQNPIEQPIEPPMTPVNDQRGLNSPGAPIRQHRTEAQRHPSMPLAPSTSNFLNQVDYPSLHSPHIIANDQRPHTLPSHFPQPQFFQSQFYQPFHQPSYNQHQYFPQQRHDQYYYPPPPTFILHNNNTIPLHTYSNNNNTVPLTLPIIPPSVPSTVKPLPSVSHIPILSGRSDYNTWNNGVRSLILYLGYGGHVANQPMSGVASRPDPIPSYPPQLLTMPSAAE